MFKTMFFSSSSVLFGPFVLFLYRAGLARRKSRGGQRIRRSDCFIYQMPKVHVIPVDFQHSQGLTIGLLMGRTGRGRGRGWGDFPANKLIVTPKYY